MPETEVEKTVKETTETTETTTVEVKPKKPSPVVMIAAQLVFFGAVMYLRYRFPEMESAEAQRIGKMVETHFYELWGIGSSILALFQLMHVGSKNIARNIEAKK